MFRFTAFTSLALATLLLATVGCNSKAPDTTAADSPSPAPAPTAAEEPASPEAAEDHAGHMHSMPMEPGDANAEDAEPEAAMSPMEKMMPGLAELGPDDKSSAMKQHICPVSGKMLGTMGAPYKTEVNGQQVWLCCPGCEGKLKENPEEYLAKLNH